MQSVMRKPVRPRAAQAAGSTPLPTVPGGQITSIARNTPSLFGMPGGQHRAHAGVGGGLGEGERVVDRALHLRVGAGPVDHHVAAVLAQGDEQADRLAVVDAVVVDPVLEAPLAVGQLLERGARQALGVVDRLLHVDPGLPGAVLADELGELPLGDVAGRELRAQVAEHLHRQAHVLLDERHQRLVELARLVELERRDAQAFGVDLGRIGGVRPGDAPADVGVVAHRAGEREPLARRDRAA